MEIREQGKFNSSVELPLPNNHHKNLSKFIGTTCKKWSWKIEVFRAGGSLENVSEFFLLQTMHRLPPSSPKVHSNRRTELFVMIMFSSNNSLLQLNSRGRWESQLKVAAAVVALISGFFQCPSQFLSLCSGFHYLELDLK